MKAKTFGFDEFINSLGKLKDDFDKRSTSLLEETANLAVAETQLRTPVDTGTLRRSIARSQVLDYSVEVGTSIEYAQYVEEGHRAGSGFVPGIFMLRDATTIAERRFKKQAEQLFKDMMEGFKI